MLSLLLAVVSAPTHTIDFTCDATRLEPILDLLSKATSMKLTCAPELRDEVLLIKASNKTQDEILSRISFALRADWKKTEQGMMLVRDANRRRENEKADALFIKQTVLSALDRVSPTIRSPLEQADYDQVARSLLLFENLSSEQEDSTRLQFHKVNPLTRRIPDVLDLIDWVEVQKHRGCPAVFSTRPAVFEHQLPASAVGHAMSSIKSESQRFIDACSRLGVLLSDDWTTSTWLTANKISMTPNPELTVSFGIPFNGAFIAIESADGTLRTSTGSGVAYPKSMILDPAQIGFDPMAIPRSQFYSQRTTALATFISGFDPDLDRQIDEELMSALIDPMETDPHAFGDTDLVLALAKHLEVDVVVAFSDADLTTDPREDQLRSSLRESTMQFLRAHETKKKDGWLTARPRLLVAHEFAQLDRRSLKELLAVLSKTGYLDVDLLLTSLAPGSSFFDGYENAYFKAVAPFYTDISKNGTLAVREFYRSLSPAERTKLANGPIPVSQLNQKARRVFECGLWASLEHSLTHDPSNPRPYTGMYRARIAPPPDLVVMIDETPLKKRTVVWKGSYRSNTLSIDDVVKNRSDWSEDQIKQARSLVYEENLKLAGLPSRTLESHLLSIRFFSREFAKDASRHLTISVGDFKAPNKPYKPERDHSDSSEYP